MKPRKATYIAHRWLALIVSVQLLAWSTGGLIFSLLNIDAVHGDPQAVATIAGPIDPAAVVVSPNDAMRAAAESGRLGSDASRVVLRPRFGGGAEYVVSGGGEIVRVDAATGAVVPMLTREQAVEIARAGYIENPPMLSAELYEDAAEVPMEARGRRVPLWGVVLDAPESPHLYVDAATGDIVARRNGIWRVFDFFWMLHVMDYKGRDNFNHLLLTSFSVLAVLTASSGMMLWGWRLSSKLKRRKRSNAAL